MPSGLRCLGFGIAALTMAIGPALAQAGSCGNAGTGSCVALRGGCNPPEQPNQCFPDAVGPTSWTDCGGMRTSQHRLAPDSPLSTCHPPVGIGAAPRCCTSFHPPASGSPPSVELQVVGTRIWVRYQAPNYACQNTGDWPPFYTCTNDPLVSSDNLMLFIGPDPTDLSAVISRAFIYYEDGLWDTGIDIPCGETNTYSARIAFVAEPVQEVVSTDTRDLTGICRDKRMCGGSGAGGGFGGGRGFGLGGSSGGGGGRGFSSGVGGPVNVGSGDISLGIPLFTLAQSPLALSFALDYHSEAPLFPALANLPMGLGWTHPFAQVLRPTDASLSVLYHQTAEGFDSLYTAAGDGSWVASYPGELRGRVTVAGGKYLLTDLDGTVTAFDTATGNWLSTTDRWGNALSGAYDAAGHLASVTDSEGRQVTLAYSGGQLTQIALPDGQLWRLGYTGLLLGAIYDPLHTGTLPWRSFTYTPDSQGITRLLTAVQDDAGALLEGHAYDRLDRGVSSVSAGGRENVTIQYDAPGAGQRTVTHTIDGATAQVSIFTLTYQSGRFLPTEIVGNCDTCAGASSDSQSFTYSPDNFVLSHTDGNGHLTRFAFNADGNVTARTEAVGSAQQRTTTYRYDYAPWPNFRTEMDEPSAAKPGAQKATTFIWNTGGAPETVLTAAEAGYLLAGDATPTVYTTTQRFDARHRLLSVAGPRTDVVQVTTQTYYADADASANRRGRLQSVTDPSGNVSTFDDYDEYGTAHTMIDPNGVVTAKQTDARGRVVASISRAVPGAAGEASDYTTSFTFDGRDRLVKTVMPRGNGMAYGYEDGTNRLVDTIRLDAGGNQLERHHLTLNVIGDKVMEEDQSCGAPAPACGSWTTQRSESFGYDVHNRLAGVLHPVPAFSRTFNVYDLDGQLSTVQDEDHTSPNTTYGYDALHRMTAVRQTLASAPGGAATTSYGYDVMDNLESVTDPNGNTTSYRYDDFHRLERQDSPVTGSTTYGYDPAGNLVATTDARGAATARTYDASNRVLTSSSQLAGAATETVTYSYDSAAAGSFGKGRLAQMTDPSGATAYAYERRGLLKSENRTILGSAYGTAYQYDANANRSGMTYPSGRQVGYTFDFADRPYSAAAGTTTYVAAASYLPFGPEARLVFGNGTTQARSYDLRYRPVENRLDGSTALIADYLYGEDAAGNITSIHDALDATYNRDFAYDDLFRLTGATTGDALWGPGSYAYDAMGNMTALALGTARTATFSYNGTLPTLSSVVENGVPRAVGYDAAGNEVAAGSGTLTYSSRNLLAAGDGLVYTYDGRGVRVAVQVVAAFGTITGTVTDQNGQPLAAAAVRITGTANATATDGAGKFNLTAPAGLYTLTVSKFGFLSITTTPFTLAAGGSFAAGTIRLQPAPGLITGRVVDAATGAPLAGATASLAENGDSTVTDAAGAFSLSEPAGTYTVTVAQAGYPAQTLAPFTLAVGATHALGTILLIANPATLTGHVVSSAGGAAIAGATVTAASIAGAAPLAASRAGRTGRAAAVAPGPTPASSFAATTDAAGNFTLQVPPGTYGVTVAANGFGSRTTSSVSLGPGAVFGFGTLTLDAAGTITGSVVAASGGTAVPGATVGIVGTLNLTTTDAAGRFTLSQAAGIYRLQVTAAGFLPATTAPLTVSGGTTTAAGAIALSQLPLAVYVAYADNRQAVSSLPNPWQGSPNVVFLGGGGPIFDAGAVRLDNATDQPIAVDRVTVDLQRPGIQPAGLPPPVFNLWGSFTVPAHGSAVLTQLSFPDFDTSDYGIVGCGQNPAGDPRIPKVTVVTGGVATDYYDNAHVLDTGGADAYYCNPSGSEALPWQPIGTAAVSAGGAFQLAPATAAAVTGNPVTLTATVTDTNQRPVPNVIVTFSVTASPGHGQSGQAVTDASGRASFTFTSPIVGTTTVQAAETDAFGNVLRSNLAKVTWQSPFPLGVFVGYADDSRPHPDFPVPWQGAPNVLFLGAGPFDDGAVRLDNLSDNPLAVDKVVVDMQVPPGLFYPIGPIFSLWGSFTIPPHQTAILTGYKIPDFDTSDVFGQLACNQPIPPDYAQIPKITVTIGGSSTSYLDTAHILDTFGTDRFWCLPGDGNESLQWREIGGSASSSPGRVFLLPAAATVPLSAPAQVTAMAVDAGGAPLVGVSVAFSVKAGPNAGRQGQAMTDGNGVATFSYSGTAAGADTLSASIANLTGGTITSAPASVTWVPAVHLALAPAGAAQQVGTPYNATLTAADGAGQPLPNLLVTFQIASGPNAGKTAQQTTGAGGQTVFSYTSTTAGADTLAAAVEIQGGGSLGSNAVTATWTSPLSFSLAPLTVTQPVGTAVTFTATLLDGGGQPVANVPVTFSAASGPDAGASAQATTGTNGQALFSFTGAAAGSDLVQATAGTGGGALVSNPATAVWTASSTAVTYTGPAFAGFNDPATLSARLTLATTGQPLAGQTLGFTIGTQALTGVTDATGTATVTVTPTVTPTMNPGAVPLSIVFAGSVGYGGSAASVLFSIHRDDTAIVYTGPPAVASGQPQPVSAVLTDAQSHVPLAGKTVTFSFGSVVASGTTDATGTATASLTLPVSVPTGPAVLQVAFAGDAAELSAATTVPVLVYQPVSFVIWGGNTPGLALGQYVNFWGSQWASQVTGGDYQGNPSFKGYAQSVVTPLAVCEPTARTSGSPQLDSSCWTSKPGNSKPPATLSSYIGVIVSTSIAKQGSSIYGNIAALVVVQVDPSSPYDSDPGHPGFGTVAAVIQDGASLFPQAAPRRLLAPAGESSSSAQTAAGETIAHPAAGQPVAPSAVATGSHRFFFYGPELHLLAESELTTASSPAVLTDYIWFGEHPIAQSDTTGTTSWIFTDHLGTPILQTSTAQGVNWRAEYEPYGAVFGLRSPDQHQPLRLPGQEAEQLGAGANGVTSRSYNIHRWYEPGTGRYVEPDPIGLVGGANLFQYVGDGPIGDVDPLGLKPTVPSSALYYICCARGKRSVCRGAAPLPRDPFVQDCSAIHERQHLLDLDKDRFRCSPCAGKPNGTPIIVNEADKGPAECSGYCAELACLKEKPQNPDVQSRVKYVNDQIKHYCSGGTCPP
jgi:RHS repeat-associated protein